MRKRLQEEVGMQPERNQVGDNLRPPETQAERGATRIIEVVQQFHSTGLCFLSSRKTLNSINWRAYLRQCTRRRDFRLQKLSPALENQPSRTRMACPNSDCERERKRETETGIRSEREANIAEL